MLSLSLFSLLVVGKKIEDRQGLEEVKISQGASKLKNLIMHPFSGKEFKVSKIVLGKIDPFRPPRPGAD